MVPDGMPLSDTEILASGDTASYFSAVGTGADDGLTAQLVAWPAAGVLELVAAGLLTAVGVGPALGVLVEHAAMEIVAATVAVAIKARFISCWWRGVLVMSVSFLVRSGRGYASSAATSVRGTETFPGPSCRKSCPKKKITASSVIAKFWYPCTP